MKFLWQIGEISPQSKIGSIGHTELNPESIGCTLDDPGVLEIQMGRKKSNIYYSVPESVAQRIYTRLLNGKLLAARSRRIYERILKDLG